MMGEGVVLVKMAAMSVVDSSAGASPKLKTTLGSCVGVILTDRECGVHGLAHIMLPRRARNDPVLGKYADTAIPALIEKMEKMGCRRDRIAAYVVGGACMFHGGNGSGISRIGDDNIEESKRILKSMKVPVVFERTGGSSGMTVIFDGETGRITVRTLKKTDFKQE
jgi:chemotaxis protein CheD